MDLVGRSDPVGEFGWVVDRAAIDEDLDVNAQAALVVEYIAAQARARAEDLVEDSTDRLAGYLGGRHRQKPLERRGEVHLCHDRTSRFWRVDWRIIFRLDKPGQ